MKRPEEVQESSQIKLPIHWNIPDDLQSRYSSHVLVQAGQFEIVLTFFEPHLPILMGPPEENKARLEELGAIQAEAVARIIMPPAQAAALIPALQTGLQAFAATHTASESVEDEASEPSED